MRSSSTTLVDGRVGYRLKNGVRIAVDALNLLKARVSDIDYYYESRLPGETAGGVADIHFHPAESRSLRLSITRDF